MKNAVVDASFILTAIFDKKINVNYRFKELLNLVNRKQLHIYAPEILFYEVANSLRFTLKDKYQAQEIHLKIKKLPIKSFHLTIDYFTDILFLAYQKQTTVYDTSYHFLAKLLNATFYTCDEEYYQKAKNLGQIELVK